MKDIFRLDGPLMRFLNTLADMITISLLWLVCSLPVVTMGASTVALYTITMRYAEDDSALTRRFLKAFRENLWKGSAAGVLTILIAVLLFLDFRIIAAMAQGAQSMKLAAWMGTAVCAIVCVYTFPLLACYEQTLPKTMKNALFIGLSNLPATLLLLLIHGLPVAAAVVNPEMFVSYALPFLSFMGPGVISLLSAWVMKQVLAKYQTTA